MDNNILVIGIAGGTGSGKTTLMNNLIAQFAGNVTVLSHDNYYKRHDDMTYEERCQLNYDEPAALERTSWPGIWISFATARPSTAPFTILPSTTGPMKPFGSSPKRSSLWRVF